MPRSSNAARRSRAPAPSAVPLPPASVGPLADAVVNPVSAAAQAIPASPAGPRPRLRERLGCDVGLSATCAASATEASLAR